MSLRKKESSVCRKDKISAVFIKQYYVFHNRLTTFIEQVRIETSQRNRVIAV